MGVLYSTHEGELVATDTETGEVRWHGRPEGHPVSSIAPIPDSEDCLVLLDRDVQPRPQHFENALRVGPDGTTRWRGELPQAPDVYVEIDWAAEGPVAWSWSGFMVRLDPETGRIRSSVFTK